MVSSDCSEAFGPATWKATLPLPHGHCSGENYRLFSVALPYSARMLYFQVIARQYDAITVRRFGLRSATFDDNRREALRPRLPYSIVNRLHSH
jgi:hypothetical protein